MNGHISTIVQTGIQIAAHWLIKPREREPRGVTVKQ